MGWNVDPAALTGVTVADDQVLFNLNFNFTTGTSALTFDQASCDVTKFDDKKMNVTYTDGSVTGANELDLKLFLEGLYNSGTAMMRKTQDYVSGATVSKFPGLIADTITVELHDPTVYSKIIYKATTVNLNMDGSAVTLIPATCISNYYISIKTRNHLETVSASAVSFASTKITYDFSNAASKAYGSNQKLLNTGVYGLYAGDIDQNGSINGNDIGPINTGSKDGAQGYIVSDITGDGYVNISDVGPVNTAIRNGVAAIKPQ